MCKMLFSKYWRKFWMKFAGVTWFGRFSTRMATWLTPPYKSRTILSKLNKRGYISPDAIIHHNLLKTGGHIFIDDGVVLYQHDNGGALNIGKQVCIYRHTILETGKGGSIKICDNASIHPKCQINALIAPITIGHGVMLAPNCAIYSYNHGVDPSKPILGQPLESSGPVIIDDGAWLGFGVIVLSGVRIGKGAVIAAGSLVTKDVPDYAIMGNAPARVVSMR